MLALFQDERTVLWLTIFDYLFIFVLLTQVAQTSRNDSVSKPAPGPLSSLKQIDTTVCMPRLQTASISMPSELADYIYVARTMIKDAGVVS